MLTAIHHYFETKKQAKQLEDLLDKARTEFKEALKAEQTRLMNESLKYQFLNYQPR